MHAMIDRAWRSLRLAFLVATLIVATLALAQQRKVVANGHQFALTHDDQLSTSRFNKNEFEHADIYRFSRNAIESFGAGRCSPLGALLLAWLARMRSAHVLRSVNGICRKFQIHGHSKAVVSCGRITAWRRRTLLYHT